MQNVNLASIEGVVDVGVLVPLCFDNPLRKPAIDFISAILLLKKHAIIPLTSIIGAYHITTRYLKVEKLVVKKILTGLMKTSSPAFYSHITRELAQEALEYATYYSVESWDGYLVALAKSLGTNILYTLDQELKKIKEMMIITPFPQEKVREYHNYLNSLIKKK